MTPEYKIIVRGGVPDSLPSIISEAHAKAIQTRLSRVGGLRHDVKPASNRAESFDVNPGSGSEPDQGAIEPTS